MVRSVTSDTGGVRLATLGVALMKSSTRRFAGSKRAVRLAVVVGAVLSSLTVADVASPSVVSAAAKDPVVIVAGTFSPSIANEPLRLRLQLDGYDAYIYELPGLGVGDIADTSAPLVDFVDDILADTGAAKVDLIGHSQGGLVARHYVKYLGGDQYVDSLVTLGTPNHGTAAANLGALLGVGGLCTSCNQMAIGSSYLNALNAGDDTIGSVDYTNIYTSYDEVVFPASTARMSNGATNVRVQSQCWFKYVEHLGLIVDGVVYSGIEDALEHRSIRFNCWAI